MTVEVLCFDNCAGQFMRMPWANGTSSWYELATNDASWDLVTGKLHAELEAHWVNDKY